MEKINPFELIVSEFTFFDLMKSIESYDYKNFGSDVIVGSKYEVNIAQERKKQRDRIKDRLIKYEYLLEVYKEVDQYRNEINKI